MSIPSTSLQNFNQLVQEKSIPMSDRDINMCNNEPDSYYLNNENIINNLISKKLDNNKSIDFIKSNCLKSLASMNKPAVGHRILLQ